MVINSQEVQGYAVKMCFEVSSVCVCVCVCVCEMWLFYVSFITGVCTCECVLVSRCGIEKIFCWRIISGRRSNHG